ncbi:hypothetical protein [Paenibacillus paeoniae]|uniref:DUF4179 domain-containing protein n=1 Tax=Paenibacillus paeoniae TaxID=2292705 RepID=A0A371PGH7_9BACL|nr:hypothetical protein [Paenibacillus paeoniae]REK75042.1 hypothetical protein DX130_15520 [Paenibacillus paeoniae]
MSKEELNSLFENMSPDEIQKKRMRSYLVNHKQSSVANEARPVRRRYIWWAAPAACFVLALAVFLSGSFGGAAPAYAIYLKVGEEAHSFKLADRQNSRDQFSTTVSNVDSRPGLEFYIEGDNIAKIEISAENEYLYAADWTKTQHEKYWNDEYYQTFDEERQISIADFSLLYDKKMTMTFDEDFTDYGEIWYRWTAWNMHQWASENNFSRFLGAGMAPPPKGTAEEREMAAGSLSGIGHIQLDDYPEELTEDTVTIIITDRDGNITTRFIHIKVSNNELSQTVVTASLTDK